MLVSFSFLRLLTARSLFPFTFLFNVLDNRSSVAAVLMVLGSNSPAVLLFFSICFLSHKLISKILIRYGKRILIQIVLVHRFGDFSIIFLLISWRNNFFIILRIIFLHFSVTCNFLVLQPFYLQPMIFHLFCLYLLSSTILFQDLFLSCLLLSHFITFPSPFRLLSYRR